MTNTIEERVAQVEIEVARLRAQIEWQRPNVTGRTRPDFLQTMIGIHSNSPAFEEITQQIESERERERVEVRRLPAEDEAIV